MLIYFCIPIKIFNDDGAVVNQDIIVEWQRRDITARNYLIATIETQQQRSLVNCRSANDMWVRLSTQHIQNAVENQHAMQQQFFEYKYKSGNDVMSHITEVETTASQLNDVGASVTPIQLMTKIICTLPPSFRNFVSAWDSVPANERTIALLTSRLLKEEIMSKHWSGGEHSSSDAAFFALNDGASANSQQDSRSASNERSNKSWRGKSRSSYKSSKPYYECSYCHKPWHTAKVCRKRIRDEAGARG
jgi:hypothetical protein